MNDHETLRFEVVGLDELHMPARAFSFRDCLSEVDAYLSTCEISDGGPALLLEWHYENLSHFAAFGNEEPAAAGVEVPDWFSRDVGELTVESLINDIMEQLEEGSGGRWGAVCLAPNTTVQIMYVASRLAEIAWHPFVQHCMRGVPNNDVVLSIATLGERATAATAVPLNVSYYGVHQFYK